MTHAIVVVVLAVFALSACDQPVSTGTTATDERGQPKNAPTTPASTPAVGFEELLGFADVERCLPDENFEKLLDGLLPTGPLGEAVEPYQPVFPGRYRDAFGKAEISKDGYTRSVNVHVTGNWKNLPVSNLAVFKTQESDYEGFAITFDAPFESVRTVLNEAGFKLPVSGKREVGEELVSYINLEAKAGKVTLTCSTG
jgi:hypothetical protein